MGECVDGLPRAVRVSAAGVLEAIGKGLHAEQARAAMKALLLTVYVCRAGR
ncbi:hypothetical protein ACGFNV_36050 [Streptomyces sp. NPDC048751]|uniref:hypothetical protein n=1 Tax=Streptomyces sp. NPDC048751 TaxID=3365591 RepID=UPI003720A206